MGSAPDLPNQVTALLAEEETVLVFTWARVQRFGTRYMTFVPIALVIEAVDRVRNRVAMQKLRERSAGLGLPLDRNMAMCVTNKRLLVWRASGRPRRIGSFMGEVPKSRITSARAPYSGGGAWRTVLLRTTDPVRIRFQVDGGSAERFVSVLNQPAE